MDVVKIATLLTIVYSTETNCQVIAECEYCCDYLISGPRGIQDSQFTASSTFPNGNHHLYDAKYARLHFYKYDPATNKHAAAWSARHNNDQQYIQAAFSKMKMVTKIVTQGRFNYDQWVTSYSVSYSTDGITWTTIKQEDKTVKVFNANTDRTTVVSNVLPECVKAKSIRIHPKSWNIHISLRFDVIGCTHLDTKALRHNMSWERHPVAIPQNQTTALVSVSSNIGNCAIQCQKHEQCMSFLFNENDHTCTGLQDQLYQADKVSFTLLGHLHYFISLSNLDNHEYVRSDSTLLCYKISTWKKTADSALNECKSEKTKLLIIRDQSDMSIIQEEIKNSWILAQQSNYFIDGSHRNGEWTYSTGRSIPSSLWSPSHPLHNNDSCVVLTLTGLKNHDCSDSLYFVCGI